MSLRARVVLTMVVLAALPAGVASAATTVEAQGNPLTGGLAFAPASVTVAVGDQVEWVNTDFFAPHTATEKHGLWNLAGTYGATPINPPGFAPGAKVSRVFEAGTHQYLCEVHGPVQSGTVAVPVTVSSARSTIARKATRRDRRRKRTIATVTATWAAAAPADGEAYDVERRVAGTEAWSRFANGTQEGSSTFRTRPGTTWEIRARLREAEKEDFATDWSPVASVTG